MTADPRSTASGLALVRTPAGIAMILAGAALFPTAARSETSTIGRTWPIAEPDALAEIEARAAALPRDIAPKFGPRSQWSALQPARLDRVTTARVRTVVPFHTLDMDVPLPDGRLLYPKGFTFNPLSYVTLPQRLLIVHADALGWALDTALPADWILLAAGSESGPDALALGEKVGRPIFILEERVKNRLGLTVAPVIVRQVGQRLELNEVRLGISGNDAR